MADKIYLDNHHATRPSLSALEKMSFFDKNPWGASASTHFIGQEIFLHLEQSLSLLYEILGAEKSDLFSFSPGGAAAINHVFFSAYFDYIRESGRNHFLTTAIEEKPIYGSMERLEKLGCFRKILPVNSQGQLTKEILEEAIKPRSGLLSLSWANALTGVVHPLADLQEVCQEKEVLLHVDATCMLGKFFFRFQDLKVDFLTLDGSRLHAPKGTGGVFMKAKRPLSPWIAGESVNGGGLAALAVAVEQAVSNFDHQCTEIARLKAKFEKGILQELEDTTILFQDAERLPNCSAVAFRGVHSELLFYHLQKKGVLATFGGGQLQILSQVLKACGIEEDLAYSALSFSLSYDTKEEEIDRATEIIVSAVKKLRECSDHLEGSLV